MVTRQKFWLSDDSGLQVSHGKADCAPKTLKTNIVKTYDKQVWLINQIFEIFGASFV